MIGCGGEGGRHPNGDPVGSLGGGGGAGMRGFG